MKIPLVGPTYNLDDQYDPQRCVNLVPEASESGTSKEVTRYIGTAGKRLFASAGGGAIRGCLTTASGRSFWVSGSEVYEIDTSGNETYIGMLNSAVGTVSMAENGLQVMLVDGVNGYIFTLATDTFAQIADGDFPNGATVCDFQDTYFLANDPDTGDFYISANNDGTSWDSLDKATVESSPDALTSLLSDHGELVLAGPRSMEVYYNSGNANFPFERISQAVMQVGIAAAHTLKSFDNNVVWVSEDEKGGRFVYTMSQAYRPMRISTRALEVKLESVSDISRAYAWVYKQGGHEFYVLQVQGLKSTWVYDAATKLWHERTFYNATLNREELDLGVCHTFFNGKNLIGDRQSGNIYILDPEYFTDNGDEIHRIRITPIISEENKQITFSSFEVDMSTGVGLVSGQGSDPKIMMRYSNDGGKTWPVERWKDIGKLGKYKTRIRWTRLGQARKRVFEIRITDPVKISIHGGYIEGQAGTS